MENIRRHFAFTGQTSKNPASAERSSVFHVEVKQEADRSSVSDSIRSEVNNQPANQGTAEPVQQLLAGFVQYLSKYHSSGTQLRQELSQTLKGTLYQPLGAMCTTKLPHNIFDRRPDFLQLANEIHALLTGLQEKPPKTEASQQVSAKNKCGQFLDRDAKDFMTSFKENEQRYERYICVLCLCHTSTPTAKYGSSTSIWCPRDHRFLG